MLTVSDLHKSYATPQGAVPVLTGIDMELRDAETLALTGESGSGKSTLLHLIAGLDHIDSGDIAVAGISLSSLSDAGRAALRRHHIGLVFQQFNLIPSLSVGDNLAFQARISGRFDPDWQAELVARLGLNGLLERYPEQLSGGQQQRVAMGRALAMQPSLLLADEPTGNLDETTGDAVLDVTLDLVTRTGCAFMMVTHSIRLAGRLERRLHLSAGQLK